MGSHQLLPLLRSHQRPRGAACPVLLAGALTCILSSGFAQRPADKAQALTRSCAAQLCPLLPAASPLSLSPTDGSRGPAKSPESAAAQRHHYQAAEPGPLAVCLGSGLGGRGCQEDVSPGSISLLPPGEWCWSLWIHRSHAMPSPLLLALPQGAAPAAKMAHCGHPHHQAAQYLEHLCEAVWNKLHISKLCHSCPKNFPRTSLTADLHGRESTLVKPEILHHMWRQAV